MARLAYCRKEPQFGFDRDRITKILERVEFVPQRFCESPSRPRGKGAHCFLAVRDDGRKDGRLAVVSFRGTDVKDSSNLVFDVDLELVKWQGAGRVHEGFLSALDEVREDLEPAIESVRPCRLVYTGHSLGAAMATLMAGLHRPDALYTFGSPLVGDSDFVDGLQGLTNYRYVDCCDLVARIPPEELGYRHFGQPHYIKRNRKIKINPREQAIFWDHVFAVSAYMLWYAFRKGNERWRELADHAPINYVWPVKASLS
ncbi:MAG: lipase family protein [Terriglobales bacterium]